MTDLYLKHAYLICKKKMAEACSRFLIFAFAVNME